MRFEEERRNFTDKNYWRYRGQAEPYDDGTKWASIYHASDESKYIPIAHEEEKSIVREIVESVNDLAGEILEERRRKADFVKTILSLGSISDEMKIRILQHNFGLVEVDH